MKKIFHISLFALMCFPMLCQAVSFDCRYVKKDTLKMICHSSELSKLDDELMIYYQRFEKRLTDMGEDSKQLFQNMIKQALNARDLCQDEVCLVEWYNRFIKLYADAEKDFSKQEEQAKAAAMTPIISQKPLEPFPQEAIPDIDPNMSSEALWSMGIVILRGSIWDDYGKSLLDIERRYLGSNSDGDYWIQEFFSDTGLKYSSPYLWPQKKCNKRADRGEVNSQCYEGELIIYAENGKQPLWRLAAHNGLQDGPWQRWYNNGHPMHKGQYCGGEKCGVWTSYHENGVIEMQGAYYNSVLRKGVWKFLDKDGKQVNEIDYKDREDPLANGQLPLFGE